MLFATQEEDIDINLSLQALYFYASWEPTHKKFLTMFEKIEAKYKTSLIAIDIDYFKNQCKRFLITSVPTVLILSDGIEIKRINGFISTSDFIRIFTDIYKDNGEKYDKKN